MNKTAIIIPSRLAAQRLPNKPLKLINNKEMILHVYDAAKKSESGKVYVASPDQEIIDLINYNGGEAVKTSENHETGTDRAFEVFSKSLKGDPNIIVNLQGDMPNIDPREIKNLINYMKKDKCDIGTLASKLKSEAELNNENVVKVSTKGKIKPGDFVEAVDFNRTNIKTKHRIYHHIGIYAFTNKALLRYVSLKRSKLELERKLEQLRAMENGMSIHVGYVNSSPLSVDTEQDLNKIKKLMEKND